jgi:ABC-type multidrug transport system permease subunit
MSGSSGALSQLLLSRIREFYREPAVLFWVYGFPILLAMGLGIAFRAQPQAKVLVDVERSGRGADVVAALAEDERFELAQCAGTECRRRLRTGRTALVVRARQGPELAVEYWFDPTRPESVLARRTVDDALQRARGRTDAVPAADVAFSEPGGRYIDFLIPGILGMNLMGGGLWGVGFVIVDMRIRKLLKRFLATPMKKRHLMLAVMLARMLFLLPEIVIVLVFARWAFGVEVHGSVLALGAVIVLGAVAFSGIGLLVASRAAKLETVSGLMNLVMLPMWLLSGIFFSYERFPDPAIPFIRALPLTPLNDALRGVMLDGVGLSALSFELAILGAYAVVTFGLALRWFRWS